MATSLPPPDDAREWLATMTLIRRFEERAGEMYARAKVGGFLHLSIGEEATIVGSARALREDDYLISTYRSHGHALVRGTPPENVMAELFGRVDGCSGGRGGSMHMFDLARRFMGGYGIVGGNLPIAAGIGAGLATTAGTEEVTLCTFGDGASNQGTFGETLNLAALWRLPVVFMVTNNQFGMGTALRRHSAVTDLQRKGESLGVPGDALRRHGRARHLWRRLARRCGACARSAGRCSSRRSPTASAATRWPTPSSTAPRRRSRSGASATRSRRSASCSMAEGVIDEDELARIDAEAIARVDAAVAFADASPFPAPESLYDDVYVLDDAGPRVLLGQDHEPRGGRRPGRSGRRPGRDPRRATSALEIARADAPPRCRPARMAPDGADALPRGAQRGPARGAHARRAGDADGRGHRRLRRRLQGHRRPARGVRRSAACATRRSPRTRSSAWASARR